MNKTEENQRVVCGNVQYRRFAYLHKTDRSRFGLLEAVDYADARQHLGSRFFIRQTWLTPKETIEVMDTDRRWQIVASIFLNPMSEGFIYR